MFWPQTATNQPQNIDPCCWLIHASHWSDLSPAHGNGGPQEQQQQLEAEFDAATELLLCAREQLSKSAARELLRPNELLGLTKGS